MAHPNLGSMARDLPSIPVANHDYLFFVAANVGAVIMPWMIFYQQGAVIDKGLTIQNLRAARFDTHSALAVDVFCYRARKYIGTYLAALGGAEAVVFGGGIGENSPSIRRRICEGMDWCGLRLDDQRNEAAESAEMTIHAEGAGIRAYVIPVDEAAIVAREVEACLSAVGQG